MKLGAAALGLAILAMCGWIGGVEAADAPPIRVLVSERLSDEAFRASATEQIQRLRLLAGLAQADVDAATGRFRRLRELFQAGRASQPETESASMSVDMARDRAESLTRCADQIASLLPRIQPTGYAAPQGLHLVLPPVSRRVGNLEFFTLPVSPEWGPAPAAVSVAGLPSPTAQLTIRGDDDLWAQRLEEIRAIPSARSTEIAQAERDLLGSRTNTALLQASLAAYQRESAELRAFATASPSERAAWPITRENLGVFLSSWRRPVPCSAPFLSISLPILRAAASAHGTLDARLADASALEERLAALRQSATKGVVNEVAVRGAEAALAAGQAKVASERERKRVAQLELDLFQNLARQAGAEPLSSKSSGPRELADALLQAASPETSWIYGLFQLWEERAVAGLEARDRTRLEERANDYLSGVKKLASPMASELSRASNQSRLATAQRLAAEEALQLVELEWDQWLAIANLGREAADPVGIPAPVLPQTQIIAEAEAEVARQWAASFAPEKAQREEAAKQLAELNRCGASTNFEVQQAEQRSVLAQAKWSAAQQDLRVTSAQRQLASDLAAQGANLLSPADLSESARRSLTTVNQLRLEPRAAEIAGLQAAAAMASSREGALSRLVRNGFAVPHEVRKQSAKVSRIDELIQLEESRAEILSMTGVILGGALRAPVSKPQEFQLPPLE